MNAIRHDGVRGEFVGKLGSGLGPSLVRGTFGRFHCPSNSFRSILGRLHGLLEARRLRSRAFRVFVPDPCDESGVVRESRGNATHDSRLLLFRRGANFVGCD